MDWGIERGKTPGRSPLPHVHTVDYFTGILRVRDGIAAYLAIRAICRAGFVSSRACGFIWPHSDTLIDINGKGGKLPAWRGIMGKNMGLENFKH